MKEQDEAKQGWEDLSNEENYKNYGKLEEGKQEKVYACRAFLSLYYANCTVRLTCGNTVHNLSKNCVCVSSRVQILCIVLWETLH